MSIKLRKQDEELANTSTQSIPSKEPSPETLEGIREGDAFFAAGGGPVALTTALILSMQL